MDLPDYKQEFLNQLEEQRQSQQAQFSASQQDFMGDTSQQKGMPFKVTNTNDIWNNTKYSDPNWRSNLTTTYYNQEHGQKQHDLNALLNPEVVKKTHNMRVTPISEYSNAKHNNTVFINPKFASC